MRQAGVLLRTVMVELMEDALAGELAHPGRESADSDQVLQLACDLQALAAAAQILARRSDAQG